METETAWRVGGFVLLMVAAAFLAHFFLSIFGSLPILAFGALACFNMAHSARNRTSRYAELV